MKTCPQCGISYDNGVEVCLQDDTALIQIVRVDSDRLLGKIIGGRFLLTQKLGQGGYGTVYKALHTRLDRVCAIKLLTGFNTDNEAAVARFKREAKLASRIKSPHA